MNIFITGGGRGIGLATAKQLINLGHRVFTGVRDVEKTQAELDKQEGLSAVPIHLDLTKAETIQPAVDKLLSLAGEVDGLVNNAGISNLGAFEDQPDEEFKRILDSNFFGHYQLTRSLLPHMRKRGQGRIVMVSSLSGLFGLPGETAYCCSKFAMEAMAECLRYEVSQFGIDVRIVNPGYTRTELAASTEIDRGTPPDSPYRSMMTSLLEVQQRGEESGDSVESVAAAVVDAVLDSGQKYRYLPGSAGELHQQWKDSSDEVFRETVEHILELDKLNVGAG